MSMIQNYLTGIYLLSFISIHCYDFYISYMQILLKCDSFKHNLYLQILESCQGERNWVQERINIHIGSQRASRSSQTIAKLGVRWYCSCQHASETSQTNTKLSVWQCRPYRCSGAVQSHISECATTHSQGQIVQIPPCLAVHPVFCSRDTQRQCGEKRGGQSGR